MGQEDASQKQKYWKLENIKCNFTKEVFQMRKHSWLKKSIASLLALTMLLGVAPFTVFAEEGTAVEQIAAEQALEKKVFEIGGEQLTIEDLEQADIVLATTVDGEDIAIPGNAIRTALITNPSIAFVGGTISFNLTRTTSMTVTIKMTVSVSSNVKIRRIEGVFFCSDSTHQTYYIRRPAQNGSENVRGTIWEASTSSPAAQSITVLYNNVTMPHYTGGKIGIMYPKITFSGNNGSYNNDDGILETNFYV